MTEQWKPAPGFEDLYEVSNGGQVRSLRTGKLLTPNGNGTGYFQVHFYRSGERTVFLVHRLVAWLFIGKPPQEDAQVNHKDFDKSHNAVDNLEWCTRLENVAHAIHGGKRHDPRMRVRGENEKGEVIYFSSQVEAESSFRGKRTGLISRQMSGKCRTAYGYRWSEE